MPTLRRVARDRSRRAGVPVEFESLGSDRRLPMELESAIFRVADESVARPGWEGNPEKVVLTLDWGEELEVTVRAIHPTSAEVAEEEPRADMPAALQEMVDDRRARAAAQGIVAVLTPAIRREIDERAAAAGGRVEFAADGRGVTARFPLAGGAGGRVTVPRRRRAGRGRPGLRGVRGHRWPWRSSSRSPCSSSSAPSWRGSSA